MFNLLSSAPSKANPSAIEVQQAGGDSPLTAGANGSPGEGSGEGRTTRAGKLFANLFAAALGERGKAKLAGVAGNDLPVPHLQIQELGAGMKLLTPADSELPQEDTLFAFAVGQGLDAALVASVLWPAGAMQDPDQPVDGEAAASGDSAAVVAALLAGIASGQVSAADGARAGASLIMAMGGQPVGMAAAPGVPPGASIVAPVGGLAGEGVSAASASLQMVVADAAEPAAEATLAGARLDFASRLAAGLPGAAPAGLVGEGAPGLATGAPSFDRAALALAASGGGGEAMKPGFGDSIRLAAAGGATGDVLASVMRDPLVGQPRSAGAEAAITPLLGSRGGEALLVRAAVAIPAQWVLGPHVERQLSSRTESERVPSSAGDMLAEAAESLGELRHDSAIGSHHRGAAATPRDGVFRDTLDLGQDITGAPRDGGDDSELARLSRKVSEGIAQRMATALANDSWKVRLDLKPAHLGQISIDMSMAQGQIEAVFDASNPAARALIADGLDRLRQDLQRSGMNVAFLSMNSGSSGGHAGKSTSQRRDDADSGPAVADIEGIHSGSSMRASKTVDGLDILV